MAATGTVTVERLDHFGLPTNDLLRAEEFYTQVLEGVVAFRLGLVTEHRQAHLPPLFFINVGLHRLGLHLQREFLPSVSAVRGLPSFGFEFPPKAFDRIVRRIKERDVSHEGPVQHTTFLGPITSMYFLDPDGNHLEVCTSESNATAVDEPLLRRIELESLNLNRSEQFYNVGMGMRVVANGIDVRGQRELVVQGRSDQFIVLHEVSKLSRVHGRRWWGPHYAFRTRPDDYEALLDQVERFGVQLINHRPIPRPPDEGDIYFDDPDGNIIQVETAGLLESQRSRQTWRSEHPWPDR